jgi:hypothetical protein
MGSPLIWLPINNLQVPREYPNSSLLKAEVEIFPGGYDVFQEWPERLAIQVLT